MHALPHSCRLLSFSESFLNNGRRQLTTVEASPLRPVLPPWLQATHNTSWPSPGEVDQGPETVLPETGRTGRTGWSLPKVGCWHNKCQPAKKKGVPCWASMKIKPVSGGGSWHSCESSCARWWGDIPNKPPETCWTRAETPPPAGQDPAAALSECCFKQLSGSIGSIPPCVCDKIR